MKRIKGLTNASQTVLTTQGRSEPGSSKPARPRDELGSVQGQFTLGRAQVRPSPARPRASSGPSRPALPRASSGLSRPARPRASSGPSRPARPRASSGPSRPARPRQE
ncbi:hypothetical protein N665_0532s0055 [Sinapis alba]|nr:hypothetical protein N665_0532s0055 [Sinapis alba]